MTYKSSIVFHDETYRIGYKGETVSLLPKEYEQFWPMSESFERTVDDIDR